MTLDELCVSVATGKVMVRGKDRDVRPITALEAQRIRRAYPRPMSPSNPSQTAAYEQAVTEWGAKMQIVEAAVGLAYVNKAGRGVADVWNDPAQLLVWCESAWNELGSVLSESEVRMILEAMRTAAVGAVEEASKNF